MRQMKVAALVGVLSLSFASAAWACDGHGNAGAAAPTGATAKTAKAEKAAVAEGDWVCPMGPECSGYLKAPGECPKCGMKLIRKDELKKQK